MWEGSEVRTASVSCDDKGAVEVAAGLKDLKVRPTELPHTPPRCQPLWLRHCRLNRCRKGCDQQRRWLLMLPST